ncbi:hypothetical protein ACSSS7_003136 [Eimeria intestinalis]
MGLVNSGEPSTSGGFDGYPSGDLSPSSVESYIEHALKSAQETVFADWLLDPDKDFPHFLELQEEDKDAIAEGDPGVETLPSMETLMLMVEEAAAIVTGEWQDEESAKATSEATGDGSTDQQAEEAVSPLREAQSSHEEVPSTSASASKPIPTLRTLEHHPYYRRPQTYPKDLHLPEVDFVHAFGGQPGATLGALLGAVRTIMAKPRLSAPDLLELHRLGVSMMAYAGLNMMRSIGGAQHSRLVQPLARRVLLVHYLLAVCDMVGPSMQREEWWELYIPRILQHPRNWTPLPEARADQVGRGRAALVKSLVDAMAILRRGERLPAQLIVPIMQQLFCTTFTIKYFQHPNWSGFREADKEFNHGNSLSDTSDNGQ